MKGLIMCLARVFTDEEVDEYLEGQPEVIEVWKLAEIKNNQFISPYEWAARIPSNISHYAIGLNTAKQTLLPICQTGQKYWSGFHSYPTKKTLVALAKEYSWMREPECKILRCLIKKEWITAVGKEGRKRNVCIVASQAVFPHYPETEARYEDLPKEKITELAAAKK